MGRYKVIRMKDYFKNTGYFLKEVMTILKLNLLSHLFSLLSTILIFFLLAMVVSGWFISSRVVEVIQGEAEVNAYFFETIGDAGALDLVEQIRIMEGVNEARLVDAEEAYSRMEEVLGSDARVLGFFNENPFNPFIEVKIHLEQMDLILDRLENIRDIEHVRDNREILGRLRSIADVIYVLGYLVVFAVGITTLVILSHIIRQGIYNSREQINTLRLLGAPEAFIDLPFLLEGLLLTLSGGLIACALAVYGLRLFYAQMAGPLPFIPFPALSTLIPNLILFITALSILLGIAGSFFGLVSARKL